MEFIMLIVLGVLGAAFIVGGIVGYGNSFNNSCIQFCWALTRPYHKSVVQFRK